MSFLVVGEALVDVITDANGISSRRPGGSPANVAVGLGRLGARVQLLTALGDDDDGALVTKHLTESGVEVLAAPLAATSVAHALVDAAGASTYDFDFAWQLDGISIDTTPSWLHVGSLGVTQQPGATDVADLIARFARVAVISYDPNLRPGVMGPPHEVLAVVERQVAGSDVVKLSDDDAAWLAPDESAAELAARWVALGPQLVVLTRGGRGATAWSRELAVEVPATATVVVDTVGAGDAFMAGLIHGLCGLDLGALTAAQLTAAMEGAVGIAGRTCGRVGADPPWLRELHR